VAQFLESSLEAPTLEQLQGTRCRLQRLRDLKFLSGWVRSATAQQITIELKEAVPAEEGEKYNLEGATGGSNLAYPCMLIKADGGLYRLSVTGEPLVTTPGQEPRYRAYNIEVSMQGPDSAIQSQAIDISASGIGVLTFEPLPRFARVKLAVRNSSTSVECLGTVRYCRPDQDERGCYRIGVQVDFEDRLSRAMWARMVQTTSQIVEKVA
jgi:hypothetical protein